MAGRIGFAISAGPDLRRHLGYILVLHEMEKARIYRVLFEYHPDSRAETTLALKQILASAPADQAARLAQQASRKLVAKYLSRDLLNAPDAPVYSLLHENARVLGALRDRPATCVAYYMGDYIARGTLPAAWIQAESDLKADIIESANTRPSLPTKASDFHAIVALIAHSYHQRGYAVSDLSAIGTVPRLAPDTGCRLATEFTEALASMGEPEAVYVMKNLVLRSLARQPASL